jgi:RND family efflux transporter MFP subunit
MMMASSPPSHARESAETAGGPPRRRRWLRLGLGVPLAVLAAVLASGCGKRHGAGERTRAVAVVVTTPIADLVTDYQDFTGRLDAVKTVDVRPRVSGYVIEAPFKEGDTVRVGDVLFRIDPRPYKASLDAATAQLAAARAQVAQCEANLKLARVTLERARRAGRGASPLEIDQNRVQEQVTEANLNLARASVGTAEANLDTARLNYEWTTVVSSLNGRISRRNVDPGNLVKADDTMLTTIVTENPLYAYFDVDERTYLGLVKTTRQAATSWLQALQFPVLMRLANEDDFTRTGKVDFLDNRVTATSGTIRMRGVFDSDKGALKPGLFVRVRLPIGTRYRALLIPDEAIQSDQGRTYVYVVNADDEVVYRPVQLGQAIKGLRVIKAPAQGKKGKEGLVAGERVIISGMQRVRPGTQVEATVKAPPKRPESSLNKLLSLKPKDDKVTR